MAGRGAALGRYDVLKSRLLAGLLVSAVILAPSASAAAPQCSKTSEKSGSCELRLEVAPVTAVQPVRNADASEAGGSVRACTDADGSTVPCSDPTYGSWSQDRNAYCRRLSPQPPPGDSRWEGHYPEGAVYECILGPAYQGSGRVGTVWLPSAPVGALPAMTPEEAAQFVVERMDLRAADIGIVPEDAPGRVGLVGLPVWMWTTPGPTTFGPQTLTGTAGGITITATARVERIVWSMGDGTSVTCTTPGTPYQESYGDQMSPDCGHRYSRTSVGKPGNAYPITATSYWAVNWTGGGASGRIDLDLTAQTQIQVGELQVLVTHG